MFLFFFFFFFNISEPILVILINIYAKPKENKKVTEVHFSPQFDSTTMSGIIPMYQPVAISVISPQVKVKSFFFPSQLSTPTKYVLSTDSKWNSNAAKFSPLPHKGPQQQNTYKKQTKWKNEKKNSELFAQIYLHIFESPISLIYTSHLKSHINFFQKIILNNLLSKHIQWQIKMKTIILINSKSSKNFVREKVE